MISDKPSDELRDLAICPACHVVYCDHPLTKPTSLICRSAHELERSGWRYSTTWRGYLCPHHVKHMMGVEDGKAAVDG